MQQLTNKATIGIWYHWNEFLPNVIKSLGQQLDLVLLLNALDECKPKLVPIALVDLCNVEVDAGHLLLDSLGNVVLVHNRLHLLELGRKALQHLHLSILLLPQFHHLPLQEKKNLYTVKL